MKRCLPNLLFGGAWLALVFWFHDADIYNRHFFDHGGLIALYNILRLVFIAAFWWYLYAVGQGALRLLKPYPGNIPLPERAVLGFFTGAGIVTVLMLALGLAGLYSWNLAVWLTAPVFFLSGRHLGSCLRQAAQALRDFKAQPPAYRTDTLILASVAALAFFILIFTRVLFPASGVDYYIHYSYYYARVLETGSVLPNDAWYHFFYSKAAGLYFLAMQLTDPLAPPLVGAGFLAMGGLLVYRIVADMGARTRWGWTGAGLFFLCYIYPDSGFFTPWGDLWKLHDLAAIMALAAVWALQRLVPPGAVAALPYITALIASTTAAALISPPAGVLLIIFAVLLFMLCRWRKMPCGVAPLSMLAASLLALAATVCINFVVTGLPTDQFFSALWPYLNLDKLSHTLGVEEMTLLRWQYARPGYQPLPGPLWTALFFFFFHIDQLFPLLVLTFILFIKNSRHPELFHWKATLLLVFFAAFLLLALVSSRAQAVSFYRFSAITLGPLLCLCLYLFDRCEPMLLACGAKKLRPVLLPLFLLVLSAQNSLPPQVAGMIAGSARFFAGASSIEEAYRHQEEWPAHMKWGGIAPGVEEAWRIAGPGARIHSFHMTSYCLLPHCRMESFFSFSLRSGIRWPGVMFGPASEARAILQAEGLNYFFFSRNLPTTDILCATPLFSPDHIADSLAIAWTDGTSALLTWKAPGLQPFDKSWQESYRRAVSNDKEWLGHFPYERLKKTFEEVKATSSYAPLQRMEW